MARGSHRNCEICGKQEIRADRTRGPLFFSKFPLAESRCKEWVKAVGKEDLVHVPIEKLHQLRYICGDHFEKKDWNKKGSRLKKRAVPKLKLSAPPLSNERLRHFPLHVPETNNDKDKDIQLEHGYTKKRHLDHTYSKPEGPSTEFPIPSTSQPRRGDQENEYSYGIDLDKGDGQDDSIIVPDDDGQDESINVPDDDFQDDSIYIPDDDCEPLFDDDCQVVYDGIQAVVNDDGGQEVVDDDDLSFYLDFPKKSNDDKESSEKKILPEREDGLHEGFLCNNCSGVIKGFRYTCVQCSDFDLCGSCEAKGAHFLHYVLRIPSPRPYAEIQSVVDKIRKQLQLGLDMLVPSESHEDTDVIIKDEVKEEGVIDPLSIDAPPTATTPEDVTDHTDSVVADTELFGIDTTQLTHENATTVYYGQIDNVDNQPTCMDNVSVSSLYTAPTEEAQGGSTVLTIVTSLEPTDSTRIYNPTDSTRVYNPTDSTIVHNPTDSTIVYNPTDRTIIYKPTDSTRVYNPSDSTRVYNPTDSTVLTIVTSLEPTDSTRVYNPTDSTRVYNPTDSTRVYNPTDSTVVYNPTDSTRVYNPRAKRKHNDVPTQSVDVSTKSAKKLKVVLTPLPVELLRNRGARLTIAGPSPPATTQYNPGVTNPVVFRVGRHRPLRTDCSDEHGETS